MRCIAKLAAAHGRHLAGADPPSTRFRRVDVPTRVGILVAYASDGRSSEAVAAAELELTTPEREGVHSILKRVRERGGATKPDERRQLLAQAEQELARLLGPKRHAQLDAVQRKWFDKVFN